MARLLHTVRHLENGLLVLLLTLMITLAGGQIVLRNLFDSGISWSDPLLRVLVLWVGMVGAMIATQQDRHIRIDLLSRYLPPLWRRRAARLNHLFSAVVCGLLAWHSGRFVHSEWQDGNMLLQHIPTWVAESILPLGFAVMTLRFTLLLFLRKDEAPE
ncbi:MAG: TRAP transporter small permease [Gammaproteobacteria bacterium]|nr:TRAP transporter small permease [Gammaproteobacteria bacterium]